MRATLSGGGRSGSVGNPDRLAARGRPLHPRRAVIGLHQRDNGKLISTLERLRDLGNTVVVVERRADDALGRLASTWAGGGRHGGRRRGRHGGEVQRSRGSSRAVPLGGAGDCGAGAAVGGSRILRRARVAAQPEGHRRRFPSGSSSASRACPVQTEVDAGQRDRLQGVREPAAQDADEAGRPRVRSRINAFDKVIDIDRSRDQPDAHRTRRPAWPVHADPRALLADARVEGARLQAGTVLVQCPRRPARRARATGDPDRDALPARRLRAVRDLQGRATTGRRSRCVSRARTSPRSWTCPSRIVLLLKDRRSSGSCRRSRRGARHIKLGQPATTLSGGEAQRSSSRRSCRRSLPADALHPRRADHGPPLRRHREAPRGAPAARRRGNTVLVIEHSLDVIKQAGWIVDLGPGGGHGGR